jgi:preprotein translocase subunit Sec61beta
MAKDTINLPAGIGGLMRYNEEYKSKIILTPAQVIIFIVIVVFFVMALKILFPIAVK